MFKRWCPYEDMNVPFTISPVLSDDDVFVSSFFLCLFLLPLLLKNEKLYFS